MIAPNNHTCKFIESKKIGYVDKSIGIDKFQNEIKLKYGLNKILRFDLGENSDGPPTKVLEELEDIKNSNSNTNTNISLISEYPDSNYLKLKKELALFYNVDIENITIGAGSSEIIKNINKCWLEKGDPVIFPIPSFYVIENSILEFGGIPTHIQLRKEQNFQWSDCATKELNIVSNYVKPKLIWLVTPNNPTGAIIPKDDIVKIIKNNQNSIIIVDEAYGEYINEKSTISLVDEFENLLVLRTFSKAYGMAGLRLGYCIGSRYLIKILESMRLEFPVTSITERLGIVALRDKGHLEKTRIQLDYRKKLFLENLRKIKNIEFIPSKTNIMLIRSVNGINLYKELLIKGILVARMDRDMKEYIRITIKNEEDNNILINHLEEATLSV